MAGLTAAGFVPETLEEIRDGIIASLEGSFGNSINTGDTSVLGVFTGIIAERLALLWEAAEAVNDSQDPDKAIDTGLDALSALTGTTRNPADSSQVVLTLTGDDTTVVAAASRASVTGTGEEFSTDVLATLVDLTAWAITTAYVVGDRRSNASRSYIVTVAGTSAGAGGPTTTDSAIVDGTVTWRYLGDGTAAVDVASTAVNTGPIAAIAFDVISIETPVAGWSGVINLLDATLGENVETNEDLRIRREDELSAGLGTLKIIREILLGVDDVLSVTVFKNDTDVTDPDGIPPHAVEALVEGGLDQEIWDALFDAVAAGIATAGTEVGTHTDTQGTDHTVKFTRPTEILIFVDIELTKDPDLYPLDGDAQVEAAITAFGALQKTGKDAVSSSISAQCFKVDGVLDVTVADIGIAADPSTSTTIAIALRELAKYDTSRITVVSSDGVP